jgi:hypothetical protein
MADTDASATGGGETSVLLPPDLRSAPPAGQIHVPRLSLKHVIIWLVLLAAMVAVDALMSKTEAGGIKFLPHGRYVMAQPWHEGAMRYWLRIASNAACLVASGVLIRSGGLRMLGRLQPGHWIVLILATVGILAWLARGVDCLRIVHDLPPLSLRPSYDAISWLRFVVFGGMFALAAVFVRDTKPWKILFTAAVATVVFAAVPFVPFPRQMAGAIAQAHRWAMPWWLTAAALIALVVLAFDWPYRARRDWVHWLGASLWMLASIVGLLANLHAFAR